MANPKVYTCKLCAGVFVSRLLHAPARCSVCGKPNWGVEAPVMLRSRLTQEDKDAITAMSAAGQDATYIAQTLQVYPDAVVRVLAQPQRVFNNVKWGLKAQIVEQHKDGVSTAELAVRFNLTEEAVLRTIGQVKKLTAKEELRVSKIKQELSKVTQQQINEIRRRLDAGQDALHIQRFVPGVTLETIWEMRDNPTINAPHVEPRAGSLFKRRAPAPVTAKGGK